MDWAIVSQVNGRRSFPDIARLLGQSKTKVGITIANLKKKGLIATEDEESAQLRSVFRKTAELLRHLIYSRVKQKRNRERIYTEFNKWNFSKGWDIRILGDGEVVENETPYDLPLKEKSDAYKQSLEQMYEAARSGLNQTELQDHLSDLFERLSKEERKLVKKHSLSKLLSSSRKVDEAGEIWDSGSEGILPR